MTSEENNTPEDRASSSSDSLEQEITPVMKGAEVVESDVLGNKPEISQDVETIMSPKEEPTKEPEPATAEALPTPKEITAQAPEDPILVVTDAVPGSVLNEPVENIHRDDSMTAAEPPEEVKKLRQENAQLRQELEEKNQQLKNQSSVEQERSPQPESETQEEFEKMIQQVYIEDSCEYEQDKQEFNRHLHQLEDFSGRVKTLCEGMIQVKQQVTDELLPSCESAKKHLPYSLQAQLEKRHQSIQLIHKMMERRMDELKEQDAIAPSFPQSFELPRLNREELQSLKASQPSLENFRRQLSQEGEEVKDRRYQQIFELRTQAEDARKKLLNLVKRKVLDILDGLYSGEQNSKPLIDGLKANPENESEKERLDQWFNLHLQLQGAIHTLLEQVKVQPMEVKVGDEADYYRHEPIGVEPDEGLKTEQVKEVVQRGYEYLLEMDTPPQVLRLAQVIMVKN